MPRSRPRSAASRLRIVYARQALADIVDIAAYLNVRNPKAAARVGAAVRATIDRVADHPLSGRLQVDGSRKAVVRPFGYLIFYDVAEATIEITPIQHPARRRLTDDT